MCEEFEWVSFFFFGGGGNTIAMIKLLCGLLHDMTCMGSRDYTTACKGSNPWGTDPLLFLEKISSLRGDVRP